MTAITSTELGASGRYISLGNPAVLNNLGPVTVLMYCRPTAAGGGNRAYGLAKNSSGNAIRMLIDDNTNNPRLAAGFNSVSSTAWPEKLGASNGVPYNSWYHLAMVSSVVVGASNEPASKIDLYINGSISTPSGSNNGVGNVTSDAASPMFLMNREGLGREFVGDVAYWAIYSGTLTSTQLNSAATYGPMTTADGVYSQLICCIANGVVYNGPMDPSNTVAIVGRSTRVTGTLPPNTNLDASPGDVTAPTLSSPTGSATGSTTGTGGVTTNEANGTLYAVCTTSATAPTGAQVRAGQDHTGASAPGGSGNQAVTSTGAKTFNATSLTPSTTYWFHFQHRDAASNDSSVVSSASFTTSAAGDTTPPTLSSPTGAQTGSTTGTGGATTNEATGTMYVVASTSATAPSAAQVKAGQMHTGAAAAASGSVAVSSTGAKSVNFTGLTPSTTYYAHAMHEDASANQSSVVSSASFTTPAAAGRVSLLLLILGRNNNV